MSGKTLTTKQRLQVGFKSLLHSELHYVAKMLNPTYEVEDVEIQPLLQVYRSLNRKVDTPLADEAVPTERT